MKIVCFGDSNTWGYDPRSAFGSRYPVPWVDLLAQKIDCETVNAGENGREIPRFDGQFQAFFRMLEQQGPVDLLILMLGTNDLLQGNAPEAVVGRMSRFLERIPLEKSRILLLAPPVLQRGTWVPDQALTDVSVALNREYKTLAGEFGLLFADSGQWAIPLAFDGVHFTPEGHRLFAENLFHLLNKGE